MTAAVPVFHSLPFVPPMSQRLRSVDADLTRWRSGCSRSWSSRKACWDSRRGAVLAAPQGSSNWGSVGTESWSFLHISQRNIPWGSSSSVDRAWRTKELGKRKQQQNCSNCVDGDSRSFPKTSQRESQTRSRFLACIYGPDSQPNCSATSTVSLHFCQSVPGRNRLPVYLPYPAGHSAHRSLGLPWAGPRECTLCVRAR